MPSLYRHKEKGNKDKSTNKLKLYNLKKIKLDSPKNLHKLQALVAMFVFMFESVLSPTFKLSSLQSNFIEANKEKRRILN